MEINWHPVASMDSYESFDEWNQRKLKRFLIVAADFEKECCTLSSYAQAAMERGIYLWREQQDQQQFLQHLRLAHLARTWHWKGLYHNGPHTVILPGEQPIHCGRMQPNIDVKLDTWFTGWDIAVVMRDLDSLEVYRTANHYNLQERGGVRLDDYVIPQTDMAKAIHTDPEFALEACRVAIEWVNDEQRVSIEHFPVAQRYQLPMLKVWEGLLSENAEQFNQWLAIGLENKKKFYEHDPPSGNFIHSFISTRYLAACAYAHDLGIPITVTSDYIPDFLIRGDFPRVRWPNPEWIE